MRGRITRQGNRLVRWVIVEAAQTARIHDESFRGYYERYASRKGHERGIVAVAHEMLRVVYFMLKRMEPYRCGNRGLSVRKFKRLKCKSCCWLAGLMVVAWHLRCFPLAFSIGARTCFRIYFTWNVPAAFTL